MESEPKPTPEQMIDNLAELAYENVGKELEMNPAEIFAARQCEQVSTVLRDELKQQGVDAELATYVGWDITSHEMVSFMQDGEEWIADATWQQFLEKSNPSLPRVLLCKKAELTDTLSQLGVPENLHHVWLQAKRNESGS